MKRLFFFQAKLGLALCFSALGCPQVLPDDFSVVRRTDAGQPPVLDCGPFETCSQACVDIASDPSHCGECDRAIRDDQICSMGAAITASLGCGTRTLCNGGCVNTQSHPMFCGACDVACKPGARCMMGNCMCAPPAAKDCGDACRECCNDADCGMAKLCVAGLCELHCSPEEAECGDRCVDLATDPRHCGECRRDCGMMGVCVNGACG